jgi:hypothetical protein
MCKIIHRIPDRTMFTAVLFNQDVMSAQFMLKLLGQNENIFCWLNSTVEVLLLEA